MFLTQGEEVASTFVQRLLKFRPVTLGSVAMNEDSFMNYLQQQFDDIESYHFDTQGQHQILRINNQALLKTVVQGSEGRKLLVNALVRVLCNKRLVASIQE